MFVLELSTEYGRIIWNEVTLKDVQCDEAGKIFVDIAAGEHSLKFRFLFGKLFSF